MASDHAPLRVMHLASGDLWAGAEVQLFNLATAQVASGEVRPWVVLFNEGELADRLRRAGLPVTVIDEQHQGVGRQFLALWRQLRQFRPRILHTHRSKENVLGALAATLVAGCSSLRTTHGAQEHPAVGWWSPRRLILAADHFCGRFLQKRVIAVAPDLAQALARQFGDRRVTVIANGLAVDDYPPAPQRPPRECLTVGLVGRLVPVKRVDLFLETARVLLHARPGQYRFRVIGDGPQMAQAQAVAAQLDASQGRQAVVFTGFVRDAPVRIADLDLLLITSDHEGLPMTLLEALALGVPVVAHAVGAIPEVLQHCGGGLLVQTHRADAYAEAVLALGPNPGTAFDPAKVREKLAERYSARANAAATLAVYRQICGD